MGGWKESGLGSRHGADGIRKYTARQAILVTPATAQPREAHYLPFNPEVSLRIAEAVRFAATSDLLSDEQRVTLAMLCDTFVPSLAPPNGDDPTGFWARDASAMGVPEAIEFVMANNLPPERVEGVRQLLDAFAAEGFNEAPQEAREQIIHAFADSSPETLAGVSSLRGVTMSLHYALPDLGTGLNPNWAAMGYPGPLAPPAHGGQAADDPAPRRRPDDDRGRRLHRRLGRRRRRDRGRAGGGRQAGLRRRDGRLLQRGRLQRARAGRLRAHVPQRRAVPDRRGPGLDPRRLVPRRRHDDQLDQLAAPAPLGRASSGRGDHGLEGIDGDDFQRHFDAVMERTMVNEECSRLNGPHERLRDACEALGYDFRATRRNTDPATYDQTLAGYMGYGDVTGSKQGTLKTYLADAHGRGADLVVQCRVERILVEDGRAAGVEGTYTGADGSTARVVVRAPQVVVAAGAIESPALLLRSGIGGPAVGKHLRLHPTSVISGHYAEPQDPWLGRAAGGALARVRRPRGRLRLPDRVPPPQHRACSPPRPPGSRGASTRRRCCASATAVSFINLTRDHGEGQVVDRRCRQRRSRLSADRRARHPQHPPRARRDDPHARRRGRGADRRR